jgi:small subunit ribosomal protein S6
LKVQITLPPRSASPGGADSNQTKGRLAVTRQYETVYIFDSTLEDPAIAEKLGKFHALLHAEGEIVLDHWGRRQLAYKIGRRDQGYYVVARFHCDSKYLPEYERALRLDDSVVRYLVSLHEHDLGAPPMTEEQLAAARAAAEDDDDEDDE